MKRLKLLFLFLFLLIPVIASAAGFCVEADTRDSYRGFSGHKNYLIANIVCTADISDGTIDSYSLYGFEGYSLHMIETWPGATAPQDNSNYTLTESSNSLNDYMGGSGKRAIGKDTHEKRVPLSVGIHLQDIIKDTLNLNIIQTIPVINSAIINFRITGIKSEGFPSGFSQVYSDGVPSTYTEMTENVLKFNIQKGQLNKFSIKPRILNEHAESSREIQDVVESGVIVGQVFRASKDNITALATTLESASALILDSFESYANSTELQTDAPTEYTGWVEDVNPATLETIIFKGGSKSMAMPLTTLSDKWTNTIPSVDFTNYTGSFDFYQDTVFGILGAEVSVFIGDGTYTKSLPLAFDNANEWTHFEINEQAMQPDDEINYPAITAITEIGFRVDSKKIGATTYIDNLSATPPPGEIEAKLWNMGNTMPVAASTSIDDGIQFTKLNNDSSSVMIPLLGGKRIYYLHNNFFAGAYKNDPTNELLIPGNYYILELKHVDTDVSIYGPDTTRNVNYYENGYAFYTPDEATAITSLGAYSDLMFTIYSMQDVYVKEASWRFDSAPNGNSDIFVFLEDKNMKIVGTITDHEEQPLQIKVKDISDRPIFLEDGGKAEWYYNDDFTDGVSIVIPGIRSYHEPSNAYN